MAALVNNVYTYLHTYYRSIPVTDSIPPGYGVYILHGKAWNHMCHSKQNMAK